MIIQELNRVLKLHRKWMNDEPDGVIANLDFKDLYGADLRYVTLNHASLREVIFYGADLREANLYDTDLRYADLRHANLSGAILRGADLYRADLREANLYKADLREAKNVPFIPMTCPEIGSYVAFKKADGHIVVLEILEDALRSSATTRKCRASKARVLRIENLDGSVSDIQEVYSYYDPDFIYKVGEVVEVEDFDMNRWEECSTGIHHFMSRQEAVDYKY